MPRTSHLTLERLNAQIAELQKKAEALRDKERQEVIAKIVTAMDHYGITAAELRPAGTATAAKRATVKSPARARLKQSAKKKGVIRFRDDEGHTWTGVGKRPNWFKEAIASGKTPQDLAVR